MNQIRRSSIRLSNKHIHPYILCIIDMQPVGFNNSNLIIENVLQLVREAIVNKAFIVIAQFKGCGETNINIINEIQKYPYKKYVWHNKNDKSKPIQLTPIKQYKQIQIINTVNVKILRNTILRILFSE